jgi:hypothetical protein
MAGRILNRRELRKQADGADQLAAEGAAAEGAATEGATPATPKVKAKRVAKAKGPTVPKVRKPRAKKAPPRLRARWCVYDGAMKQIAVFDYNQRPAADEKLGELLARKKGAYFIQVVKEPMAEAVPEAVPVA